MNAVRLLVALACAAPLTAAPVPKDFDRPPTAAQLQAAKEAFAEFNGQHHASTDAAGRTRHYFWIGQKFDGSRLAELPVIPFRHDLALSHSTVTDSELERLKPTRQIEKLDLRNMKSFTGRGLEHLAKLGGLTELGLGGTPVSDASLAHLRACKGLTSLVLYNTGITDDGLKELVGLDRLAHLDLSYTKVTASGLKHLKGKVFPNLLSLAIHSDGSPGSGLTDAGAEALLGLPELESLDARYSSLTAAGLRTLTGLKRLTKLRLSGDGVTDAGVADLIAGMPQLTVLDLGYAKLTDAATKGLDGLKNLTDLNLKQTAVADATLARLAKLKKLTRLDLSYTKMTDAGMPSLRGLIHLAHLDIRATRISDDGLKELVNLKRLSWLNLMQTDVSDAGLAHVAKWTGLTRLHLTVNLRSRMTKEAVDLLRTKLPKCDIVAVP